MQETDTYRERSRIFLDQAFEELRAGDLAQASEKGWGAAAQIVKAWADAHELEHRTHRALYAVVGNMVQESGDMELGELFHSANSLHINFYEQWLPIEMVTSGLDNIEKFVAKVEQLL